MKRLMALAVLLLALASAAPAHAQSYANVCPITTQTTTVCLSGPGVLRAVVVNTAAATATLTIYDALSASGTPIAVITTTTIGTLTYNVRVLTGITVVSAVANPSVSVTFN
jgi:hypothetical protein